MKKIMNHKIIFTLLAIALALGACKKNEFLDVNKNLNSPEDMDVKFLLPTTQANIAYTVDNQLGLIGGFWAQYWTQGPNANQYNQLDQYVYTASDADRPWSQLYTNATNLDIIISKAAADPTKKNYGAVAYLLKAYNYQLITDAWGDVPLSESLKGRANTAPHFDKQEQVYDSLASWIQTGLNLLDPSAATPDGDIVYEGDLERWYKFGCTLKLKVYLRQTEVRPTVAQSGIADLIAFGPEFIGDGDDANLYYSAAKNQQNPLYANILFLQAHNLNASLTSTGYLLGLNDPRIADFYDANSSDNYVGIAQGNAHLITSPQSDDSYSHPSDQLVGATALVRLMTASESGFLQAEAIARGYMTGDDAATYNAAITSSWLTWTNASAAPADSLTAYLAKPDVDYTLATGVQGKVKRIITQKWVAMCGNQNFESWTEWRRTGYPDFFVTSATTSLGGNTMPARVTYPSAEVTSNANFPGVKPVQDRMWWDTH